MAQSAVFTGRIFADLIRQHPRHPGHRGDWHAGRIPVVLGSSAFVPASTMPSWLRAFAEHQPVSLMMDAVRGLLLDHPASAAIWQALVWSGGLLVVLVPLAVWAYGWRTAR
jgi:ABC-type uncharacterized transport system permease subunit